MYIFDYPSSEPPSRLNRNDLKKRMKQLAGSEYWAFGGVLTSLSSQDKWDQLREDRKITSITLDGTFSLWQLKNIVELIQEWNKEK